MLNAFRVVSIPVCGGGGSQPVLRQNRMPHPTIVMPSPSFVEASCLALLPCKQLAPHLERFSFTDHYTNLYCAPVWSGVWFRWIRSPFGRFRPRVNVDGGPQRKKKQISGKGENGT